MTQLSLNLTFGTPYLVGCRVGGEIQQYRIDCYSPREAQQAVEDGVPGARPILAVIYGGKVESKPVVSSYSHTPSPSAA